MNTSPEGTDSESERARPGHWREVARQWRHIGPPLRPAAEDVELCAKAVREWSDGRAAPRVLLLGVTPELFHMPWPEGTDFIAADHTPAMIESVWPGPKDAVLYTEWLDLALPRGSRDIVLCDGGLHLLPYRKEQQRLVDILRGIIAEGGLCVFRLFLPGERRESPDAVIDDLFAGKVPNLNVLKFRLWMALAGSASEGVSLATVWRAVHDAAGGIEALADRTGWPVEHTLAINTYRDSKARYYFATLDEVKELFCGGRGGFEVHRLLVPSYELGEQCPTIVLRRSSKA